MARTAAAASIGTLLAVAAAIASAATPEGSAILEARPDARLQAIFSDFRRPAWRAYLDLAALRGSGVIDHIPARWMGRYAPLASFVGDYTGAEHVVPVRAPRPDPAAEGYAEARKAIAPILERIRNRPVVFVNESHGDARTRAAIFTLLRPLREAGFTHLAIETLTTVPVDGQDGGCATDRRFDAALSSRGFAVEDSGYYTREPVFGEIIREAVRLGFVLVGYEPDPTAQLSIAEREEGQARNIACAFKSDPKIRIVGIVGHGHASKATSTAVPEGWMAARFARMTGIDPFTIDTTYLLQADASSVSIQQPQGPGPGIDPSPAEPQILANDRGDFYTRPGYDLALLVAPPTGREVDGPHWLELGGIRRRHRVDTNACAGFAPCIVEARPLREGLMGTPSDSCVATAHQRVCTLFLTDGWHVIRTLTHVGEMDVRLHDARTPAPRP